MKTAITIALIFIGVTLNAQARLGSSRYDILSEFYDSSPVVGVDNSGQVYIDVEFVRANVRYYLDQSGDCSLVFIMPKTQGDLNFYVEYYNNSYVILSSTSWKMYSTEGSIAKISLMSQDGVSVFVWQ